MECKWCNGPITGKGKTCSGRCRQALSRSKCDTTVTDSCDKPSVTPTHPVTLQDGCTVHLATANGVDPPIVTVFERILEPAIGRAGELLGIQKHRFGELVGPDVYYWPRKVPKTYDEWLRRYQPIPGDWDYVGCVDDTVTPAVLRSAAC